MFRDASGLIRPNPPALHYGVAATDLDGDGASEFVVAGFGCANRVLKWRAGRLDDVTEEQAEDPLICRGFRHATEIYKAVPAGGTGYVLCLSRVGE